MKRDLIDALEAIYRTEGGELRTEVVEKKARNPNSPLHAEFEWDDRRGAYQNRLNQARGLIQRFKVALVTKTGQAVTTRHFVSVTRTKDLGAATPTEYRAYRTLGDAMSVPEERRQLLGRALREMKAWRERHRVLHELQDVFDAVDRVTKPEPVGVA